jgi:hypothetical protein
MLRHWASIVQPGQRYKSRGYKNISSNSEWIAQLSGRLEVLYTHLVSGAQFIN